MTTFAGQRVLITGAGSGIGRLLAQRAIYRGAYVIAWDIDADALDRLAAEFPQRTAVYRLDLASREQIKAAAEQVIEDHGGIDILINNAGIVCGKPILQLSDEQIERTFEVNALAGFWTVRAFLPGMIARGHGHIVTVASAAAINPAPLLTDYGASKAAAAGFDDALRLELKRYGLPIQTTGVLPFYIDTGMFAGAKSRFNFLLPVLKPEKVADSIINAVENNRARLIMPPLVYGMFPLRLLPPALFDAVTGFFGVSKSMDKFTGRGK